MKIVLEFEDDIPTWGELRSAVKLGANYHDDILVDIVWSEVDDESIDGIRIEHVVGLEPDPEAIRSVGVCLENITGTYNLQTKLGLSIFVAPCGKTVAVEIQHPVEGRYLFEISPQEAWVLADYLIEVAGTSDEPPF